MNWRRSVVSLISTIILVACGGSESDGTGEATQVDAGGDDSGIRTGTDGGFTNDTESQDVADTATTDTGGGEDVNVPDTTGEADTGGTGTAGTEREPNNTAEQANPIALTPTTPVRLSASLSGDDLDFYSFTPEETAELTAGTSGDGLASVDTVIEVFDSGGSSIGRDDDGGGYPYSEISVAVEGGSEYFIVVQGYDGLDTGAYFFDASLNVPVCGDRQLSAGEECDDGNETDGDGCNDCRFEAIDEVEDNDTPDDANAVEGLTPTTPVLLRGHIDAGDADVFAVPMGHGDSFIRIDVMGVANNCFDAKVELIGPDKTTVLDDTTYGSSVTSCATLAGVDAIQDLDEGTHYVRVTGELGDDAGDYLLGLVVRRAECGNGVREGAETCDDRNEDPDDGCNECELDADPEREPNDDVADAQSLGTYTLAGGTAIFGELEGEDVDYFKFTVADQAIVELYTDDGGSGCSMDTEIELYDLAGDLLAEDNDGGESYPCSLLGKNDEEMQGLAAGTYRFVVRKGWSGASNGTYVLHLSVRYPVCGDGQLEGDEICDDDNEVDDDGCSATCTPEGTPEEEPNDEIGDVTPISLVTGAEPVFFMGEISGFADADYFGVTVTAGARIGAKLWNGAGGCTFDGKLTLRDNTDTIVRDGVGLDAGCWQVGGAVDEWGTTLEAGTYYARIASPGRQDGGYQLVLWAYSE